MDVAFDMLDFIAQMFPFSFGFATAFPKNYFAIAEKERTLLKGFLNLKFTSI
jgi:hypothetical protein